MYTHDIELLDMPQSPARSTRLNLIVVDPETGIVEGDG
jgi:hypothetical protein